MDGREPTTSDLDADSDTTFHASLDSGRDRGQAYTLEGFIGAIVVLMAVLFALQSVVITPTTGGLADRTVQAQLQQETQDALVVAAGDEHAANLSYMVRYWDGSGGFNGTDQPGPDGKEVYSTDAFAGNFTLGEILDERLTESGRNYNVELHYENGSSDEFETAYLVYQGSPPSSAQTASYTVTLYDNQSVTGTGTDNLSDAVNPPISEHPDANRMYNVVEVRVIVW